MHALLNPSIAYEPETETSAITRYTGFGSGLFDAIYTELPSLVGTFTFFRDNKSPDVWAISNTNSATFGVQLDPEIEVICLWNESTFDEIGAWESAPILYAIARIKELYAVRP